MIELAPTEQVLAIHRAFEQDGIPHAFGGAISLAYMTKDPRGTSVVDINVFVAADECGSVLDALPSEVEVPDEAAGKIARDAQVRLHWGETPIDLFFNNLPIHEEAERHVRSAPFVGVELPVLGPVELVVFKAMFNRSQDWVDIEQVIAAGEVDLDAVRAKLAELLGDDDERFSRLKETIHRAEQP